MSSGSSFNSNDQNQLISNKIQREKCEINSDLAIAWVGLKVYGRRNFETTTILNDINGSVEFGTMTALMGPSGAGKTTLLKCINGRNISGIDENTDIYLNAKVKIRSCFIVQDIKEHLLSGLTALQSLTYASKLKNRKIDCDHKQNALDLLSELGISHTGQTLVETCSGGEQKRLAIALELTSVEKPNLLCIDEPTSGLDSFAAEELILCLKHLTELHRIAVVTSIHQPNNEIVMKFDKLYVLAMRGICIYEGPPRQLTSCLSSVDINLNEDQVPIEVLIMISSRSDATSNEKTEQMAKLMSDRYQSIIEKCQAQAEISTGISPQNVNFNLPHLWHLIMRSVVSTFGNRISTIVIQLAFILGLAFSMPKLFSAHVGESAVCIIPGSLQPCNETNSTLTDEMYLSQNKRLQIFSLFYSTVIIGMPTILTIAKEVFIFLNEHKNGWYSTGSYYWAKTLVEIPLCLVLSIPFSYILYISSHQINEEFRIWLYVGVILLATLVHQGIAMTIAVMGMSDNRLALMMTGLFYLSNLLMSGFYTPIDDLPVYIKWMTYLFYAKQTFEMQMYIIYGFDRCPTGQTSQVLYQMNIVEKDKFWLNRNILIAQAIIIRIVALIILLIKTNQYKIDEWTRKVKRYFRTNRAG